MSSYVSALERWDEDASLGGGSESMPTTGRFERPRDGSRLDEPVEPILHGSATAIAFAGVNGRERAGDVARRHAEDLAAGGERVLLVDFDPAGDPVAGALSFEALLESEQRPAAAEGVVAVVSQPRFEGRPRAFEVRARQWLEARRGEFDRVVVHAGSVLESGSAAVLAAWADSTAVVVRAQWTAREDVCVARDRLHRAGSNLIGAVLVGGKPLPSLLERMLSPFAPRR